MNAARVAAYGFVCGARSMSGLAALAHSVVDAESNDAGIRFLRLSKVRFAIDGLAASELILDKLPGTPPRTSFLGTLVRVSTGATAGTALAELEGEAAWQGTAVGASCALAGTWATYGLRLWLQRRLPDWLAGLVEDAVVVGAAAYLVREGAPPRLSAERRPTLRARPEPELAGAVRVRGVESGPTASRYGI